MTPPPRPEDDAPPPTPVTPGGGWEAVDPVPPVPVRDPLLDDPLFADLVEVKPLPDLTVEPVAETLPAAEPLDALPVAEEAPAPKATPVRPPRPRPVTPPPRPELPPPEASRPRWFAACAVLGCFGLGFLGALAFIAYAAIMLLQGVSDLRPEQTWVSTSARPGPVAPTTMGQAKVPVVLPATVDAVGRAAGGRFLLLRTPRTKEIHVFDPNVGRVVRQFDVGDPQALFAGSASKLFVYRPNSAELDRWDLTTGQKEHTERRPDGVVKPDSLVVGAGVDGPVYLLSVPASGGASNVRELDPVTLRQKDGGSYQLSGWRGNPGTRVHVRASDDGAVLGVTTPEGAQVVRFAPRSAPALVKLAAIAGQPPLLVAPSADGRLAFTPVGMYDATDGTRKTARTPYTFPPAHGTGLFLSLNRDIATRTLTDPVRLHPVADPDVWVELEDVGVPRGLASNDTGDLPPDQRVHVWPAAGVALVIPPGSRDQQLLNVRKVDVKTLLQEGINRPYLLVGSEPQLWAERGREWRYAPAVWTNVEGVTPTVTKVGGPNDLQVRNGELVWTPGAAAPESGYDVTIRVSVEGLTTEQKFRIAVVAAPDDD
ncbi:hypothetical protein J0H58_29300 [bacterium]|nr:hypothetical protein [bacterium]